jgi:hypothetical protein
VNAVYAKEDVEDKVFTLELPRELIGDMEQKSGVKVIHPNGDV